MFPYPALDQRSASGIHFLLVILPLLVFFLTGCEKDEPTPSRPSPPVVDAIPEPVDEPAPDAGPDADAGDTEEPETGFLGTGDEAVVRAVGKARKSVDVGLARQAASNRARHKIAKLLKEKGYTLEPPGILNNVVIERIWTKGKFVYALGVLSLTEVPEAPSALNHPGSAPSNTPEAREPDIQPPSKGGNVP